MGLADDLPGQLHVHPVTQVEENAGVELADDLSDELLVHLVPRLKKLQVWGWLMTFLAILMLTLLPRFNNYLKRDVQV